MDNTPAIRETRVARVTCSISQQFADAAAGQIFSLGFCHGSAQSGRAVRQFVRPRRWGLPGLATDSRDFPMTVFRMTVPTHLATGVMHTLAGTLDLNVPGRGSIFVQDATEFRLAADADDTPAVNDAPPGPPGQARGVSRDLTLVTAILSEPGSGERFARMVLEFGAGVPLITLGSGTGIRNRLGLLRITIPPEKEIVQLVVPAHDAGGILRLLIESSRMDRPGGGFVYQTPISYGITDSLIRIGRQQHAASIEQVIATLDEISGGTAWRKRYSLEGDSNHHVHGVSPHREISFLCADGMAAALVAAVMKTGAGGATLMRPRRVSNSPVNDNTAARELGVICVPPHQSAIVMESILNTAAAIGDTTCTVQIMDAPAAYSYQRGRP